MKNTIKNMELILETVENELKHRGYQESKTLMNTYRTLLDRPLSLNGQNSYEVLNELVNQGIKLEKLFISVEKLISDSLVSREFKDADNLAEIGYRMELSSEKIRKYANKNIGYHVIHKKQSDEGKSEIHYK